MCGLKWGELYERYGRNPYNPDKVDKKLKELYTDGSVKKCSDEGGVVASEASLKMKLAH